MTNILMSLFKTKQDWNEKLEGYLKGKRVLVLPFSFGKDIEDEAGWLEVYGEQGKYFLATIEPFLSFGVAALDIHLINYFTDDTETIRAQIKQADVLFFPGGYPDLMMKRLEEKAVIDDIRTFQGTIIGYSAGAMIQMEDYHISPDKDYAEFSYNKGLPLLKGFAIEVHYDPDTAQQHYIQKVMAEKNIPVYAIGSTGMLIIEEQQIQSFGHVYCFNT